MLDAILDIETTGLDPKKNRITEICILLCDGPDIIREFTSLVNPQQKIPAEITELTGIHDAMVSTAPLFTELADHIESITEGARLIAHNIRFDLSFLQHEFARLDKLFHRDILCTLRMSQKTLPHMRSYSLQSLNNIFNLNSSTAHRAESDAKTTYALLRKLENIKRTPRLSEIKRRQMLIELETFCADLPQMPGVLNAVDENQNTVYLASAINIKQAAINLLKTSAAEARSSIPDLVRRFEYTLCGGILEASITAASQIEILKPQLNHFMRPLDEKMPLYTWIGTDGFRRFIFTGKSWNKKPFLFFEDIAEAQFMILHLIQKYKLCRHFCGLERIDGPCSSSLDGGCLGACCGRENSAEYSKRSEAALKELDFYQNNFSLSEVNATSPFKIIFRNSKAEGCTSSVTVSEETQQLSPVPELTKAICRTLLRRGIPLNIEAAPLT